MTMTLEYIATPTLLYLTKPLRFRWQSVGVQGAVQCVLRKSWGQAALPIVKVTVPSSCPPYL